MMNWPDIGLSQREHFGVTLCSFTQLGIWGCGGSQESLNERDSVTPGQFCEFGFFQDALRCCVGAVDYEFGHGAASKFSGALT
jgi:hypothetical protein